MSIEGASAGVTQKLCRSYVCQFNARHGAHRYIVGKPLQGLSGPWPGLRTRDAARIAIVTYIESFYNRLRLHQTLGYRTPHSYLRRGNEYLINVSEKAGSSQSDPLSSGGQVNPLPKDKSRSGRIN